MSLFLAVLGRKIAVLASEGRAMDHLPDGTKRVVADDAHKIRRIGNHLYVVTLGGMETARRIECGTSDLFAANPLQSFHALSESVGELVGELSTRYPASASTYGCGLGAYLVGYDAETDSIRAVHWDFNNTFKAVRWEPPAGQMAVLAGGVGTEEATAILSELLDHFHDDAEPGQAICKAMHETFLRVAEKHPEVNTNIRFHALIAPGYEVRLGPYAHSGDRPADTDTASRQPDNGQRAYLYIQNTGVYMPGKFADSNPGIVTGAAQIADGTTDDETGDWVPVATVDFQVPPGVASMQFTLTPSLGGGTGGPVVLYTSGDNIGIAIYTGTTPNDPTVSRYGTGTVTYTNPSGTKLSVYLKGKPGTREYIEGKCSQDMVTPLRSGMVS